MRLRFSVITPNRQNIDVDISASDDISVEAMAATLGYAAPKFSTFGAAGDRIANDAAIAAVVSPGSSVQISQTDRRPAQPAEALNVEVQVSSLLTRPPREFPLLEDQAIAPPVPPDPPLMTARLSISMMLVPLVVGGLLVFVFGPMMAIFALLSPLMIGGSFIEDKVRKSRWRKRADTVITEALPGFQAELIDQRNAAVERFKYFDPTSDVMTAWCSADEPGRLWERRLNDPDFLQVTAGYSASPWEPSLGEVPRPHSEWHPMVQDTIEAFSCVDRRSSSVQFDSGVAVGAFGDAPLVRGWARHVVGQLVVCHGPADLQIAVLTTDDDESEWGPLKWLPHTVADPTSGRLLLAARPDEHEQVLRVLGSGDRGSAHCLVIVDGPISDRAIAALRELLAVPDLGVAALVLQRDRADLPEFCQMTVEHSDDLVVHHGRLGTTTERLNPVQLTTAELDRWCRSLARWRDPLARSKGADLPASVSLLSLLGRPNTPEATVQHWSATSRQAPLATLGVGDSGPLVLSLHTDGPHGLVGGTTGSGKSELLRTIVMSLALDASPEDLNFVLVDYKGGAAFDMCASLPHVAGLVTDLDDHLAERALKSLEAELARREHFLRDYGADDIDAYWATANPEPLPRLMVIVDEFALLAAELPDFVDSLVEISQTGRSLGVHLLLATQRPAGVIKDNIRANTNIRVGLRVQRPSDSDDVLGAKDAARLPRAIPGRALVRIGTDDLVEFQTACVSFDSSNEHHRPVRINQFEFAHQPDVRVLAETGAPDIKLPTTDARRIVESIELAAAIAGIDEAKQVWAPVLTPETSVLASLTELETSTPSAMWLAIGDNPMEQSHVRWSWDPVNDGNLLCFGTGSSGCNEPLVTAAATVTNCDSGSWEIHALDFAGTRLADLAGLPTVGSIVRSGERERITRLLGYLVTELDQRRRQPAFARVLLLIDDYAGFRSEFDSPADYVYQDAMVRIVRDGPAVGIHTIIAAAQPSSVPNSITGTVVHRLAFSLADKHDYAALGLSVSGVGDLKHRQAIHQPSGMHMQALAVAESAMFPLTNRKPQRTATEIKTLPEAVKIDELQDFVQIGATRWQLPIGLNDSNLEPALLDLAECEHTIIAGPARSGRSSFLGSIADLLSSVDNRPHIIGLAPRRSPLHDHTAVTSFSKTGAVIEAIDQLPAHDLVALLVDDALKIDPDSALSAVIGSERAGLHVFAAGRSDQLRNAFNHWTRDLRQQGTGVILRAQPEVDNDLFGVRIPKHGHPPSSALGANITAGTADIVRLVTTA